MQKLILQTNFVHFWQFFALVFAISTNIELQITENM